MSNTRARINFSTTIPLALSTQPNNFHNENTVNVKWLIRLELFFLSLYNSPDVGDLPWGGGIRCNLRVRS
jgi:hypothetical protein